MKTLGRVLEQGFGRLWIAVGYGLGDSVARIERVAGAVEHILLIVAAVLTVVFLGWRLARAARMRRAPC